MLTPVLSSTHEVTPHTSDCVRSHPSLLLNQVEYCYNISQDMLPAGLQVTFGAHNADSRSALGVALLRTGGIISGVLLFMTLTIIILPKSATIESLRLVDKQSTCAAVMLTHQL